jgi:hypothetical protein
MTEYEFSPVKYEGDNVTKCLRDEADAFGLYLIDADGLAQHVADFQTEVCMAFARCSNLATTGIPVAAVPFHIPACERCKARLA